MNELEILVTQLEFNCIIHDFTDMKSSQDSQEIEKKKNKLKNDI